MRLLGSVESGIGDLRRFATAPIIEWAALLALCGAYLQSGLTKAWDLDAAAAEMRHFNLEPAKPFALAVILLELSGSLLILTGFHRWLGALALAGFTAMAAILANPFWAAVDADRLAMTNAFMEHYGLVGGFILVAWHDLRRGI